MPRHMPFELRLQLADSLRESLRTVRYLVGLSQAKMAQRVGMGVTAYGRYERGSKSLVPTASTLRRMYQEVRGPLDDLLEPEGARASRPGAEPSSGRRRSSRSTSRRRPGPPSRARRARRLEVVVDLE
jgi:transcriptional regulator with XRE-family HTH domain